jgi:release factor glutamine methyltransferase
MTLSEHLETLRQAMGSRAAHEAADLLAHAMGLERSAMFLAGAPPEPGAWSRALVLAARRAAGEPLQYLIGWVPFLKARIDVGPGVLIPRPETEYLVEQAMALWSRLPRSTPRTALDVGTGSGCMAIAAALEAPALRVYALDISEAALSWAGRNAVRNGVQDRVTVHRSDVFSALPELGFPEGGASLILSNPPYVARGESESLPAEVVQHEPDIALFSENDGLDHLDRISGEAHRWLSCPGLLVMEIGESQKENALALLARAGAYSRMECHPDLAGRPRILCAWKD